jgi:DNA polymerase alpha subunit B
MRAEEVESLEVNGQPPATDTMASLARHILQQRRFVLALSWSDSIHYHTVSFYPLFPTPLDLSHEVNLDVSHLKQLALCHEEAVSAPDVLIIPSRLKHFSKVSRVRIHRGSQPSCCFSQVVDHTTAINPSFVAKNITANLVFGGNTGGSVSSRIKVDVGRFSD